jgi:hypothetical protein
VPAADCADYRINLSQGGEWPCTASPMLLFFSP